MLQSLMQPQEVEVFYIIPTIRKSLAQALKHQGMPQKNIAELLSIQASTVSQYLNNKRAHTITFPAYLEREIRQAATTIKTPTDVIRIIQTIIQHIKTSKTICDIHRQVSKNLPKGCDACFIEQLVEVKP
ncbi:MAG TPA: transcriptional regulator [Candidatus Nanoarchaeia archaeon]|nr:transcriptional regulator [Candidatus Nanoarchaeia archaeon]